VEKRKLGIIGLEVSAIGLIPGKLPRAPEIGLEAEARRSILAEHLARRPGRSFCSWSRAPAT